MINKCNEFDDMFHYALKGKCVQDMRTIKNGETRTIKIIMPFPLYANEVWRSAQLHHSWGRFMTDMSAKEIECNCKEIRKELFGN